MSGIFVPDISDRVNIRQMFPTIMLIRNRANNSKIEDPGPLTEDIRIEFYGHRIGPFQAFGAAGIAPDMSAFMRLDKRPERD